MTMNFQTRQKDILFFVCLLAFVYSVLADTNTD